MSLGLYDCGLRATKTFRTFEEGKPELIRLGIRAVDETIGGLGPGAMVVIGLPTGVGKSSLALHMLMESPDKGGYCSMEDPEDLLGARLLARVSGVDSLRIRRKAFSAEEAVYLMDGLRRLEEADMAQQSPMLDFMVGKPLATVEEALERQAAAGCRFSILDYLQKVRGESEDRRQEVGRVMGKFQAKCHELGLVAIILSQFARIEPGVKPKLHNFKESGDIENEARMAIIGWQDPHQRRTLQFVMAKSTYGGAGLTWTMHYDESGSLRDGDPQEEQEIF